MKYRYIISSPELKPIFNIYCVSGTYGGYEGPSNLYSLFDSNKLSSNIIKIHTSSDLNLCWNEVADCITEFNSKQNLPMILIGWSQGGYTIIKAIEKLSKTQTKKKIKSETYFYIKSYDFV